MPDSTADSQPSQSFADRLRGGQTLLGTMLTTAAPQWLPLVSAAGVDAVFIDTEHTPLDRREVAWMCRAFGAAGIASLVRIPAPDPYQACMALDDGATGVIAPYIETLEQVRQLVGATKHRPLKGHRLAERLGGQVFESALETYSRQRCRNNVLLIQVESQRAVDDLAQLVAVEGVDGTLLGPHDLTCNMGIPEQYDDQRFIDAVAEVCRVCRAANVAPGMPWWPPLGSVERYMQLGIQLMFYGSDAGLFGAALEQGIKQLRQVR
ncbi:HpcH/HpaI aldolase family protein [Roseimaritima ulvae]|uniref:2-keto-3-deoxy-L-rhamnonate aldolase n=1 Tax=Roseimaritima ulvae TaxID=980254 RepID=A0A5B9R1I1_9BACT|nr:aldolase/citrate lyase family protein [Roseimaritima ulvae]QEG43655.1 2-keto-3-deoxy-L-rhamnonate aldolase [Roseimaritima ulvae]